MKKIVKMIIGISFIVYTFALVVLLFLGQRGGYWIDTSLLDYMKRSSNFIPFKTIHQFITAYENNRLNLNILIENLLGNLLLFFPMGLYLPYYYRKLSNSLWFFVSMLILLFIVEATQLVTRRGSFDIDDFILNMIGALIGYGIWRMPVVQKKMKPYIRRR